MEFRTMFAIVVAVVGTIIFLASDIGQLFIIDFIEWVGNKVKKAKNDFDHRNYVEIK